MHARSTHHQPTTAAPVTHLRVYLPQLGDRLTQERHVVADDDHRPTVRGKRPGERLPGVQVEVVGRLVHDNQVRVTRDAEAQEQFSQFARRRFAGGGENAVGVGVELGHG